MREGQLLFLFCCLHRGVLIDKPACVVGLRPFIEVRYAVLYKAGSVGEAFLARVFLVFWMTHWEGWEDKLALFKNEKENGKRAERNHPILYSKSFV